MTLPNHRIWNVNFPKGEARGFRLTGQDNRTYHDMVEQRLDPRKDPYYWIGGDLGPTYAQSAGSDAEAALAGYVSLTPLRLDMACPDVMGRRNAFDAAFNGD
jgi:5'-nucleotidase